MGRNVHCSLQCWRGFDAQGGSGTPEYRAWSGMRSRCYNNTVKQYQHYGARGVTVCERWRHDFQAFLSDMGKRPSANHSLDRIDVDGHYEPDNCRWATRIQQANNTRRTVYLTVNGETLPLSEWARRTGISHVNLQKRVQKMTPERAVTLPVRPTNSDYCLHGHPYTDENTAITVKGARRCRTCTKAWQKKGRARRTEWQRLRRARLKASA